MRLRLVLLTAFPELFTPQRIAEAVRRRGGEVELQRPARWWRTPAAETSTSDSLAAHTPTSAAPDPSPRDPVVLLTRAGPFHFQPVLREHRRLEKEHGLRPFARRSVLRIAADQWSTLETLRRAALPIPRTHHLRHPRDLDRVLDTLGPGPWFVKGRRGSKGSHVLRATTRTEAREASARYFGQGESHLLQEDLGNRGAVRRVLVIGDSAAACVRGVPAPGEYRSNVHRGGRFEPEPRPEPYVRVAQEACARIGARFCAVDLIGDDDPRILELNASPGLEGIEQATGLDLADRLAEELHRFAALVSSAAT